MPSSSSRASKLGAVSKGACFVSSCRASFMSLAAWGSLKAYTSGRVLACHKTASILALIFAFCNVTAATTVNALKS